MRTRRWPWLAAGVAVGSLLVAGAVALNRGNRPPATPPPQRTGPEARSVVLWQRPGILWEDHGMTGDVTLTLPDKSTLTLHRDGQTITVRDPDQKELWTRNVVRDNNLEQARRNDVIIPVYVDEIRSPTRLRRSPNTAALDSNRDDDYYWFCFTNKDWGIINYKTSMYYKRGRL